MSNPSRRADLGRERFIGSAIDRARWYIREGAYDTAEEAASIAMQVVLHDRGSGVGTATCRAALREWDLWRWQVEAALWCPQRVIGIQYARIGGAA